MEEQVFWVEVVESLHHRGLLGAPQRAASAKKGPAPLPPSNRVQTTPEAWARLQAVL